VNPEEVNLRGAVDPTQSCGSCGNFQQGQCGLLGIPVEPQMVCDAFAPIGAEAPAAPPADPAALEAMLFGGPQ
jgi:hypothetical protein